MEPTHLTPSAQRALAAAMIYEQQRHKTAMIRSLPPRQYPALVAHAEAMTYCSDVDLFFDLGIDHYIAGVTGMAPGAR